MSRCTIHQPMLIFTITGAHCSDSYKGNTLCLLMQYYNFIVNFITLVTGKDIQICKKIHISQLETAFKMHLSDKRNLYIFNMTTSNCSSTGSENTLLRPISNNLREKYFTVFVSTKEIRCIGP